MLAAITGDIINSQEVSAKNWLVGLKQTFHCYGTYPKHWKIFIPLWQSI